MITAKEARDTVVKNTISRYELELGKMESMIKQAVKENGFSCRFYFYPLPEIKNYLEKNGYKVELFPAINNEVTTVISW